MSSFSRISAVAVLILMGLAPLGTHAQVVEPDGVQDHALITRFPGSQIIGYDLREADALEFVTGPRASAQEEPPLQDVKGHITTLIYQAASHRDSVEKIFQNYLQRLEALGATTIFSCSGAECGRKFVPNLFGDAARKRLYLPLAPWNVVTPHSTFRYWNGTLAKGGSRYHIRLLVATPSYADYPPKIALDVVDSRIPVEQLPGMTVDALAEALKSAGRVALEYVDFDSGSAQVKFEASKTLKSVAEYLQKHPTNQVFLVGHTALTEDYQKSLELSKARAQAVVDDLVQRLGVAPERLMAVGVGPVSPIANPADELGRLRNNRLELVLGSALPKE